MGFYRGPNIVRDNLFIHLDAESYRSYTTDASMWYDLSGNGNHGTKTGTVTYNSTTPASYQSSESPEGNWDFTDIDAVKNADCTFSVWFKIGGLVNDQTLFSKGTFATTQPLTVWYDVSVAGGDVGSGNTQTIDVVVYDGSVTHRISAPTNTINSTSKIYCLDVVIQPSSNILAIYVDGTLRVSNTKTWNGLQDTTAIYKLGASSSAGWAFGGDIYNSKVYSKALNASEILQNFNAHKQRFGL